MKLLVVLVFLFTSNTYAFFSGFYGDSSMRPGFEVQLGNNGMLFLKKTTNPISLFYGSSDKYKIFDCTRTRCHQTGENDFIDIIDERTFLYMGRILRYYGASGERPVYFKRVGFTSTWNVSYRPTDYQCKNEAIQNGKSKAVNICNRYHNYCEIHSTSVNTPVQSIGTASNNGRYYRFGCYGAIWVTIKGTQY